MPTIDDTKAFIEKAHANNKPYNDQPYHTHPIAVMESLAPFASEELKLAALLHDVIEDTQFKRPNLEVLGYSAHTLDIVAGVTNPEYVRPANISDAENDKLFLEHYQGHITEMVERSQHAESGTDEKRLADDIVLLKFADMTQNLHPEAAAKLSPNKQQWYALKYGKPFQELAKRAQEIAAEHGYVLTVDATFGQDAEGRTTAQLNTLPTWAENTEHRDRVEEQPSRWTERAA